jgi:DNA-binding MarR family transcriptional regulator
LPPEKRPKGKVIELPVPNIPIMNALQKTQATILHKIDEFGGKISNTHLRSELEITPQKLSYHIKELKKKGLIVVQRGWKSERYKSNHVDSRILTIELTNAGKLVVSWTNSLKP